MSNRSALAALVVIALSGTAPAVGQPFPEPDAGPEPLADGVTIRSVGEAPPPEVDESLLRYLAGRRDTVAVETEIARLKKLHPTWQPPTDLYGPRVYVDEKPLWQLYEKRDFAGLRDAIAKLKQTNPDWQPPANLVRLAEIGEARAALERANDAKDWAAVLAAAAAQPQALTCENVDLMWAEAEARGRTGDLAGARTDYADIIRRCDDADARYATLQKAQALLGADAVKDLLDVEAARPHTAEQTARLETLRAPPRPAVVPQPPALTRLYRRNATIADARAAMATARSRRDVAAARKIGWLLHGDGAGGEAAEWFSLALSWRQDGESARGLATVLAASGDLAGLEALGKRWPRIVDPMLDDARSVAIGRALTDEDWAAVLAASAGSDRPDRVLPRGWAYMGLDRPTEAMLQFDRILQSAAATPKQRDEGVFGLIRAYVAMNQYGEGVRILERYGLPTDQEFALRAEFLVRQANVAFDRGDYRQTLLLLERRRNYAMPDRALEIEEAWALYKLGHVHDARRVFARLNDLVVTDETLAGLSATNGALGVGD